MATNYPGAIDGYSQIRIVRDNIDEIIAGDHNDLRSAVIALEQTLGINPQGAFGSVTARLNDAYANIEKHASGLPPRHTDSHIDSPARSGSPYSLSVGTVATQLNEILTQLNASTKYAGSGGTTFADGYSLPSAYITSTITQIVKQLGLSTGSTKIGGAATAGGPTDASVPPYNFSATTLRNQLVALLTFINNYTLGTGASFIGAEPFLSAPDSKYTFSGTNTQDKVEEAGAFLNENANLLERAFDSFVNSGMAVTQSGGGPNAAVATGFIASDGRLLKYAGGTVSVSATPGIYYIYAKISGGSVTVSSASSVPFSPINPVVVLHKITHAGGAWSTSVDMRRFGMLMNDKSCFTVGDTPSGGSDGYGCDFTTLRGAVEYVKIMNASTSVFCPKKIILVNDVTHSGTTITIDVEGLEIEGAGRKVKLTSDIPLFTIDVDNVRLSGIHVEANLSLTATVASLARIGSSISISGIRIADCTVTTAFGYNPLAYFIRCGSNTTGVSSSMFVNNVADIAKGGIDSVSSIGTSSPIQDSIIDGNKFYQNTFATTDGYGIRVSAKCAVSNNIISGGFVAGVFCGMADRTNVSGNVIVGYSAGSGIVMNNGIAFYNSAAGQDSGALIDGNTIFGVNNYGINCKANASGSATFMMVSDNVISNYYAGTPPASMVGIKGCGTETWVVGNKITAPGIFGVVNASHVIGNQIFGATALYPTAAIQCALGATEGLLVSDNWIYNCAGYGIDMQNATRAIIVNNVLRNVSSAATEGIYNVGTASVIDGNLIVGYTCGIVGNPGGGSAVLISNNRLYDLTSHGILLIDFFHCSILGNQIIGHNSNHSTSGIYGPGGGSIIANNKISNISTGGGGYYGITTNDSGYDISIFGNILHDFGASTSGGIYVPGGWNNVFVSGNTITDVPNNGINLNGALNCKITNNMLVGSATSSYGIIDFDDYSMISDNFIYNYGSDDAHVAIQASSNSKFISIVNNQIMNCQGHGIDCNGGTTGGWAQVIGNFLKGADHAASGIINVQEFSTVSENMISYYGYLADSYGIASTSSAGKILAANNIIVSPGPNMWAGIYLRYDIFQLVTGNLLFRMPRTAIDTNGGSWNVITNNYAEGRSTYVYNYDLIRNVGGSNLVSGNYLASSNCRAIHITGTDVVCSNNTINNNIYDAIELMSGAHRCSVINNRIQSNKTTNAFSGVVADGTDWIVVNNNFFYNIGPTLYFNCAINIENSAYVQVNNNYAHGMNASVLTFYNCTSPQINNNYIYKVLGVSGDGIYVFGSSSGSHVCGNFIVNPSRGVRVISGSWHNIVGNQIHYPQSYGLELDSSVTESVISSNTVYRANYYYAYNMSGADRCAFVGNLSFYPQYAGAGGVNFTGCVDCIVSGNIMAANGTALGFAGMDAGATMNVTAAGNISKYGNNPGSWGSGNNIDTFSCRYIT